MIKVQLAVKELKIDALLAQNSQPPQNANIIRKLSDLGIAWGQMPEMWELSSKYCHLICNITGLKTHGLFGLWIHLQFLVIRYIIYGTRIGPLLPNPRNNTAINSLICQSIINTFYLKYLHIAFLHCLPTHSISMAHAAGQ